METETEQMRVYFPSMYGDINIRQDGENVIVQTTTLSEREASALTQILKKYDAEEFAKGLENREITIPKVKLEKIHDVMRKILKKNKPTITAIKLSDGKLEVVADLTGLDEKPIEAAVTTERPRRGCPMPTIEECNRQATDVLRIFLSPEQLKDYEGRGQFLAKGGDTGKPYIVTSRWCERVKSHGHLYDVMKRNVICASCPELLPAEELLALKLCVEFDETNFLRT